MKKVTLTCGLITTALVLAPAANAEGGQFAEYENGRYTDVAEVIEVQPIVNSVHIATPRRECWDEEIQYRHRYHGSRNEAPTVLGGIIGGVAGHQFGKGDGNTLMTIAGALLGGSLARDHAGYHHGRHHYGGYSTAIETRCSVHTEYREEERVDGYRVKYRYDGRIYTTRTSYHPGERIRVNVNVTPAE